MPKKVIIIGPAHPLRGGGITTFNHRLCKEFLDEGYDCSIFSFSLQYPSFLFPGTSQYTSEPAPEGLKIYSVINSIHPLNWIHNGNQIKNLRPDIVVVRYWLPFMGPALGTILRRIKKNKHTRIVAITDNVIPHEKRFGDIPFTRYFLKSCDAFITMSEKVMKDLKQFIGDKPAKLVPHPLYDNFGSPVPKAEARKKLGIEENIPLILFFGFIRKYKGLDILLRAMKILQATNSRLPTPNYRLLIAGEFYEDKNQYNQLIDELGIKENLILRTDFIPDSEVKYYLSAADVVIQPYRNATQSGVTPLAYHFEKPMIVTNVGSLPDLVPHEKVGLVCEPEPASIAAAIERYFQLGENYFLPHLRNEKEKYGWGKLVEAIVEIVKRET
jgi:glycosyltransferase involved in cell wall biosynthesis